MDLQRVRAGEKIKDPLQHLRVVLAREYGGAVPRQKIDEVAEHALAQLEDARIRDFVLVFAWRHARDHLRRSV